MDGCKAELTVVFLLENFCLPNVGVNSGNGSAKVKVRVMIRARVVHCSGQVVHVARWTAAYSVSTGLPSLFCYLYLWL